MIHFTILYKYGFNDLDYSDSSSRSLWTNFSLRNELKPKLHDC